MAMECQLDNRSG